MDSMLLHKAVSTGTFCLEAKEQEGPDLHKCVDNVQIHEPESVRNSTGGRIQSMENVSNFLAALSAMDFPPVALFSIADMEADDSEDRWQPAATHWLMTERCLTRRQQQRCCCCCCSIRSHRPAAEQDKRLGRPLVTKCLLTLKRFHDTETSVPPTPRGTFRAVSSPREQPGRSPLPPRAAAPSPAMTATPDINYDAVLSVRAPCRQPSVCSCHMPLSAMLWCKDSMAGISTVAKQG